MYLQIYLRLFRAGLQNEFSTVSNFVFDLSISTILKNVFGCEKACSRYPRTDGLVTFVQNSMSLVNG